MIDEQEQKEEEFLRKNGWYKITQQLWAHKDTVYHCCHEVAVGVQKLREEKKNNKFNKFLKIFRFN